jgi:hypothetical protein
MKVTQYIVKTAYLSSGVSLLTDRCSGAFVNAIDDPLFIFMLSVIVVLATGCFSASAKPKTANRWTLM